MKPINGYTTVKELERILMYERKHNRDHSALIHFSKGDYNLRLRSTGLISISAKFKTAYNVLFYVTVESVAGKSRCYKPTTAEAAVKKFNSLVDRHGYNVPRYY